MKTKITIMLAMILALPLVLAMYGGESKIIPFNFETDNCTIVPNVTEGINFTFNSNNVLIEPAINFVGKFNITCYDWKTKETKTEEYGGGGYYTYPWRNKTNTTEVNETIDYVEPKKDIDEVIIEEPIIEEPKPRKWWWVIAIVIMVLLIILITWFAMIKSEEKAAKDFEGEDHQ